MSGPIPPVDCGLLFLDVKGCRLVAAFEAGWRPAVLYRADERVSSAGALLNLMKKFDPDVRKPATSPAGRQVVCVLAGTLLPLGVALDKFDITGAWLLVSILIPAAMILAIPRLNLDGLDRLVKRTIPWAIMTALAVAAFIAIIALLRAVLFGPNVSIPALVATAVVTLAFRSVLSRVQRGVNHLLCGDRDEPYRVVTRLGEALSRTVDPFAAPALLAETVARSLRVPYVAVEAYGRHGPRIIAEHGLSDQAPDAFIMLSHGEPIGRLLVAPGRSGGRFTRRERMLLADVALHAAAAVEVTLLTQDQRESQERFVVAREEERRRLRRDLHDGLGPSIAGVSMQLRAAQRVVAPQAQATAILHELADDLQTCMADVRRLVDQLRPSTFDHGPAAVLYLDRRIDCSDPDSPRSGSRGGSLIHGA
jgi:two-component system NarL family sensor kinase